MACMFKEKFKYYKRKVPPPNFEDILIESNNPEFRKICPNSEMLSYDPLTYGMVDVKHWKIYELNSHPGLIFICNPFTGSGQRYWISKILSEYTIKPHKTNLDALRILKPGENWWQVANCEDKSKPYPIMDKMRWATLGYHYNWDQKIYDESLKSKFPEELAEMCALVAQVALGLENFEAQAAIANFYAMDSTLSGHVDNSELNANAPIISYSFGQNANFLVGGFTLNEEPRNIYLRSGDIAIMAGESRLRYHGIPRIRRNLNREWNDFRDGKAQMEVQDEEEAAWKPYEEYVEYHRININARQVLFPNQTAFSLD